jgi:hypothetical protein
MDASTEMVPARRGISLRASLLLAGAAALVGAAWLWRDSGVAAPPPPAAPARLPTRLKPEAASQADAQKEAPSVAAEYRREVVRPRPVQGAAAEAAASQEAAPAPASGSPAARRRDEKKSLPELFRMPPDSSRAAPAEPPAAPKPASPALSADFAPFGRLVKCQLVDALDSATSRTEPIVALVTQDLDWNGSVIIPAGTEAFGYAKPEPVIDTGGVGRLVDSGEWTLVLPAQGGRANGRELILRARAVDRRESVLNERGEVRSWGPDDGADGLVGYTLSTVDRGEIKLFAAAALGGFAQGVAAVAERQQPAPGVSGVLGATQIAPTLGNAVASSLSGGAVDVANELTSRIRQEISKRGVYVRVPAGKPFYLFVEQSIDPKAAGVGLRLPRERAPSP